MIKNINNALDSIDDAQKHAMLFLVLANILDK